MSTPHAAARSPLFSPPRVGAALLAALLGAAGCATDKRPPVTALTAADFSRAPRSSQAPSADAPADVPPAPASPRSQAPAGLPAEAPNRTASTAAGRPPSRRPIPVTTEADAREGVLQISAQVGPPVFPEAAPDRASRSTVVDSLVGQINGRPVFASEFFAPLDGRLRALSQETRGNMPAWQKGATEIIYRALETKILDELILAEAYSALPAAAKEVGLRVFLDELRSNLVRQTAGSAQLADQMYREAEDKSLDAVARDKLHQQLIISELQRRVLPRVNVSSRDMRQYYDRNFSEYNPPAVARLHLIRVSAQNQEAAGSVSQLLTDGTSFTELAARPVNQFLPDRAGLTTVVLEDDYADSRLFAIPELNDAAKALSPGQYAGPVSVGTSVMWVYLDRIDQPPGVSFYDAQLDINRKLWQSRFDQELSRYRTMLFKSGSFSNINDMVTQLVIIAADRYFERTR